MRFCQSNWSIETAGWSVDYSEGMLTLCPADVDAALQMTCLEKTTGNVTDEELHSLARGNLGKGIRSVPVICGAFKGYSAELVDGEEFCRKWFLRNGGSHLFVTYNCDAEHKENHREVVDWMLSRLQTGSPG